MAGNRPNLTGSNITGVSGAQHGAKRNAAAMQRVGSAGTAGSVGSANFEFASDYQVGTTNAGLTGVGPGASGVGLAGNNITGVSGAQHGANRNAAAMQRAGQKAGK